MDKNGCSVKVTYIETQFVTSDAAGFKDLVQRLTGSSSSSVVVAPAPPVHRPRPVKAADGTQPPCHLEELDDIPDFSDLFYFGGNDECRRGRHNGGYNDFPY